MALNAVRHPWNDRAFIPDLVKIKLLLPALTVGQALGFSFSWGSFNTGGGILLSILIGVILLSAPDRRRGGLLLAVGALIVFNEEIHR